MRLSNTLITCVFLLFFTSISAKDNTPLFYKINIKKNIGSNTWVYLQNGLHEATEKRADAVIIHMNTYGGGVLEADSMRTAIINCPLPVYVFVDNNAASAGALIAIACDKIYMRKSASLGAATVVTLDGAAAPDKYQSYMRATIRATAETHGQDTIVSAQNDTIYKWRRDPLIAEAMVDERVVIPGLVDSTQVLTFTATQAVEYGYCDGIAENIDEIATRYLGYNALRVETYNPTFYDNIKGFLTNGAVQAFLIMIIIGSIYMEIKIPGIGLPTAIALTAAILYFTPLYLEGYAQNWEVLLFVLGLILIVFELFVVPGFGITGISGIILVFAGLFLAMIGNIHFDFKGVPMAQFNQAVLTFIAGIGFGVAAIVYMSSRIGKRGVFKHVALQADQEGYMSVPLEPQTLVGSEGIAATVLRPSGRVLLGGEYYDAVSVKGFIEKGEAVVVRKYENFQLYVIKKQ